ncbi:MAG: response regulator transcription factor [Moraxellaceae bacterium]|nr:MAG: response regulator transcription factor [Moraxellaceae bacterium]
MMQSLFISPSHIESPRWQQAFPSAHIFHAEQDLPADMRGNIVWVVLSDIFTLAHIAKWVASGARVIGLTQAEDPHQAKQVLEAGANGYLHYLAVVPVLQQASQVIEMGGLWLGVDLMRQLVFATANIIQLAPEKVHLDLLSAREQDVAKAVAAGKSNKEVARELAITERTVKAHLSAVFDKLHVRDRLHLVLVLSGR